MKELPESVRSRLRQAPAPGEHPDADMLAAFAERSLSEHERDTVAAHLAGCADCRYSLALAAGSMEHEPAPKRFRNWHVWTWGLAAAAMACSIAAVVRWERPAGAPAPDIAQVARAKPPRAAFETNAAPVRQPAPGQSAAPAPKVRTMHLLQPVAPLPPAIAPAPPAASAASGQAPAPEADALAPGITGGQAPQAVLQPKAKSALAQHELRTGAFAPEQERMPQSVAQSTGATSMMVGVAPAPSRLRWSINASPDTAGLSQGFVQNSTDGRNWQTVALNPEVNFRSVAARGPEVWVGGSNGVLLHSLDYGVTWTSVTVASGDARLSGDIVRVEALGHAGARVETSAGEKWITTDGGAHWMKTE